MNNTSIIINEMNNQVNKPARSQFRMTMRDLFDYSRQLNVRDPDSTCPWILNARQTLLKPTSDSQFKPRAGSMYTMFI